MLRKRLWWIIRMGSYSRKEQQGFTNLLGPLKKSTKEGLICFGRALLSIGTLEHFKAILKF